MVILINASNLKAGGGLQVADSICRQLNCIKNTSFVLVLSSYLKDTAIAINDYPNIKIELYDIVYSKKLLLTGRDYTLDGIIKRYNVDKVLTIFGPSWWVPRVPHLCGFASGQIAPQASP